MREAGLSWEARGLPRLDMASRGKPRLPAGRRPRRGKNPPAADLKALQAQAIGTQQGAGAELVDAQRVAGLAAEAVEEAEAVQRLLQGGQAARTCDHADAAEVEGALAAVLAVDEAVVGGRTSAGRGVARWNDRSEAGEEVATGGDELQGGVALRGGSTNCRPNKVAGRGEGVGQRVSLFPQLDSLTFPPGPILEGGLGLWTWVLGLAAATRARGAIVELVSRFRFFQFQPSFFFCRPEAGYGGRLRFFRCGEDIGPVGGRPAVYIH